MINQIITNLSVDSNRNSNANDSPDSSVDKLQKEFQYTKTSLEASSLITQHEYERAYEKYESSYEIATELNDSFKINDASTNLGIALFFLGKIKEANEKLEAVYNSITSSQPPSSLTLIYFVLKTSANLVLCDIANNKTKDAMEVLSYIISIISKEVSKSKQKRFLKYVNYIFFRVETLNETTVNSKSNGGKSSPLYGGSSNAGENLHKEISFSLMSGFNDYLKNGNIDGWIDCLRVNGDKMKTVKDFNGLIFAIFNHEASVFLKETSSLLNISNKNMPPEAAEAKMKITALLQALNNSDKIEEKTVDKILKNFKEKMNCAYQIYQQLLALENKIFSSSTTSNTNSVSASVTSSSISGGRGNRYKNNTEYFIKMLLKHAIAFINQQIEDDSLRIQMTNQIETTLSLIENKQLNVSDLKLESLSPEISKSLHILIDNLFYIFERNKKRNVLMKYKERVNKMKIIEFERKIKNFFEEHYLGIYNGDVITKINMTSSGQIDHFYQLDYDRDLLEIFKKPNSASPEKLIDFNNVIKIMIGIRSKNLFKKLKNLKFPNQPWRYMSIIMSNRSIDFCFSDQGLAKKWFYGLFYYLTQSKRKYKLISCSGYMMTVTKMKIMSQLDLNPTNITSMSFVKALLKYNRTNKL